MSLIEQTSVVTKLNTKKPSLPGGQLINPIGTDVRYISHHRADIENGVNNNNNLEEELILGTNRIIKSQNGYDEEDNECVRKVIEYRNSQKEKDYYFLDVYLYGSHSSGNSSIDINYLNDNLNFVVTGSEGNNFNPKSDPYVDSTSIRFKDSNFYINEEGENPGFHQHVYATNMSQNEDENKLLFYSSFTTEIDKLYYQYGTNANECKLISIKEIREEYDKEGIHSITELITKNDNSNEGG